MQYSPYEEYEYPDLIEPELNKPTLIATKTIRPVIRNNLIIKPIENNKPCAPIDRCGSNHVTRIEDVKFLMPYKLDSNDYDNYEHNAVNVDYSPGILLPIVQHNVPPAKRNPRNNCFCLSNRSNASNNTDFPYMY